LFIALIFAFATVLGLPVIPFHPSRMTAQAMSVLEPFHINCILWKKQINTQRQVAMQQDATTPV
jgi:hypothetical protein